mmetsp:Transcript_19134/g.60838  ORF Transcript_19134/g.60838 Transcript_19134/m.60838 type:complete len:244 (+) Transcript_19134:982-1713(+)
MSWVGSQSPWWLRSVGHMLARRRLATPSRTPSTIWMGRRRSTRGSPWSPSARPFRARSGTTSTCTRRAARSGRDRTSSCPSSRPTRARTMQRSSQHRRRQQRQRRRQESQPRPQARPIPTTSASVRCQRREAEERQQRSPWRRSLQQLPAKPQPRRPSARRRKRRRPAPSLRRRRHTRLIRRQARLRPRTRSSPKRKWRVAWWSTCSSRTGHTTRRTSSTTCMAWCRKARSRRCSTHSPATAR